MLKAIFENAAAGKDGTVYGQFTSMDEKKLNRMTMNKFTNNHVHAAKFPGIARNTLRQRLASHEE